MMALRNSDLGTTLVFSPMIDADVHLGEILCHFFQVLRIDVKFNHNIKFKLFIKTKFKLQLLSSYF